MWKMERAGTDQSGVRIIWNGWRKLTSDTNQWGRKDGVQIGVASIFCMVHQTKLIGIPALGKVSHMKFGVIIQLRVGWNLFI